MSLHITLLYGSYRENRLGIRAVKHVQKALKTEGHHVTFVDAMEENLPMLDKRYSDYEEGKVLQNLQKLHDLFQDQTDAFVIVSGEYNGTIQPGLMNLMDHYYTEFFHRPVGIVTYSTGILGGARVSMHLLSTLCNFGMSPIPTRFGIGKIDTKLDEDGNSLNDLTSNTSAKFVKELTWYGTMFKEALEKEKP